MLYRSPSEDHKPRLVVRSILNSLLKNVEIIKLRRPPPRDRCDCSVSCAGYNACRTRSVG